MLNFLVAETLRAALENARYRPDPSWNPAFRQAIDDTYFSVRRLIRFL